MAAVEAVEDDIEIEAFTNQSFRQSSSAVWDRTVANMPVSVKKAATKTTATVNSTSAAYLMAGMRNRVAAAAVMAKAQTAMKGSKTKFPFDLSKYKPPKLDYSKDAEIPADVLPQMKENLQLVRDSIVAFTACGSAAGYGGHTGGAYDIMPEVTILDAMFKTNPEKFVPIFFDEAGHRVAAQYLWLAIEGKLDADYLKNYRRGHSELPGHPEPETEGIKFASGRLGHMWPYVNGVAMANPGKAVICLGSDGSQMEGNMNEAARLAVAANLNVKVIIDDNDVTIAGNPSDYLKGYSVGKTLAGQGMTVIDVDGDNLEEIYKAVAKSLNIDGPVAVCIHRPMCPGIEGLEGECHGHDAISVDGAVKYLSARGHTEAIDWIKTVEKSADPYGTYKGAGDFNSMRGEVSSAMVEVLDKCTAEERKEKCIVVDSDLEGSTGSNKIREAFPEMYVKSGIMERGNFSACAGFGMEKGKQGIFTTFCAFAEMIISEVTMARLNQSNVLCHFSHSGVDDMADNTCHFGINVFFGDNGLAEHGVSPLYMPADCKQANKMVHRVFWDEGIRFFYSLRSKVPDLLKPDGSKYYTDDYVFEPGKDEILLEGTAGYVVAVGDCMYRANDAVLNLREQGIDVGLVNKPTLNILDEESTKKVGSAPFVLVVEPFNKANSLGVKYGYWLSKLGCSTVYDHIGIDKNGSGGLWEHAYHQGYDSESVQATVKALHEKASK
jgi:transketolase